MDATINGLMDGISVLEHKEEQPAFASDILFNDKAEELLTTISPDDGFIFPSMEDYPVDYMDMVTLLSMPDEKFELSPSGND